MNWQTTETPRSAFGMASAQYNTSAPAALAASAPEPVRLPVEPIRLPSPEHIPSKNTLLSKIKKFLDITDDNYAKKFININDISEDTDLDINNLKFPGHRIHYIVLKNENLTSDELKTLTNTISSHSGYDTIIDYIPTTSSDTLPGMVDILNKIRKNELYDFIFDCDSSFPECSKCIVEHYIVPSKLKRDTV